MRVQKKTNFFVRWKCFDLAEPLKGFWRIPFVTAILYDGVVTVNFKDFPGGSDSKASAYSARDLGSISGSEIPWRRKWQPTPVFLPGKSHGQRSLVDYSPWGHKESDTTEWLHFLFPFWLYIYIHITCIIIYIILIFLLHFPFPFWLYIYIMHNYIYNFNFWLHHAACGILFPWPGIESRPLEVESMQS